MKVLYYILLLVFVMNPPIVRGQHKHADEPSDFSAPLSFTGVRNDMLTDPALKNYKMESSIMSLAPGAQDTIQHRHDCDLFGYVLEGEVQIGLEHKDPITYRAGQMFFEKRNILHTLTKNHLKSLPSRVLLIFIIKSGRQMYIAEKTKSASNN